jgi:alkylation response protein AidB-like acyl-CoA dehydrogenase
VDFRLTDEENRFRDELRRFLEDELPNWWKGIFVDDERVMPFTRDFCGKLADRGWLTMAWPEEHGGAGASVWLQAVVREEMWAVEEPRGPQYMNLNYIGPLIMRFGTPEQKQRFLPPMARGEIIWCQGFSEPEAGSDLASLRTRATVDGDRFIINGQKVWTSYADSPAEWCLLLARTDPEADKHKGISVFLLDMSTPGVTVRPIPTMGGPHEFNEVFFDDAVVERQFLLGELHRGWDVVVTGLTFERVGIARYARARRVIDILVDYVKSTGLATDLEIVAKLADLRIRYEAARLLNYGAIARQAAGEVPTTEASVARMHNTQLEQLVGHVGLEILGAAGQLNHHDPGAPLDGEIWRQWVGNIPTTVAAGTLEIQRNIVARSLGLPRSA